MIAVTRAGPCASPPAAAGVMASSPFRVNAMAERSMMQILPHTQKAEPRRINPFPGRGSSEGPRYRVEFNPGDKHNHTPILAFPRRGKEVCGQGGGLRDVIPPSRAPATSLHHLC